MRWEDIKEERHHRKGEFTFGTT